MEEISMNIFIFDMTKTEHLDDTIFNILRKISKNYKINLYKTDDISCSSLNIYITESNQLVPMETKGCNTIKLVKYQDFQLGKFLVDLLYLFQKFISGNNEFKNIYRNGGYELMGFYEDLYDYSKSLVGCKYHKILKFFILGDNEKIILAISDRISNFNNMCNTRIDFTIVDNFEDVSFNEVDCFIVAYSDKDSNARYIQERIRVFLYPLGDKPKEIENSYIYYKLSDNNISLNYCLDVYLQSVAGNYNFYREEDGYVISFKNANKKFDIIEDIVTGLYKVNFYVQAENNKINEIIKERLESEDKDICGRIVHDLNEADFIIVFRNLNEVYEEKSSDLMNQLLNRDYPPEYMVVYYFDKSGIGSYGLKELVSTVLNHYRKKFMKKTNGADIRFIHHYEDGVTIKSMQRDKTHENIKLII